MENKETTVLTPEEVETAPLQAESQETEILQNPVPAVPVAAPAVRPRRKTKIRDTFGDRMLELFTTIVLILLLIIVAYPVIYVISSSFSSNGAIVAGKVVLWPVGFNFHGYRIVFEMDDILLGYRNTIFYTFFGVLIKMFMQITCAYPLSKMNFQGRKAYTRIIVVTMLVNAGMIPLYLVKKSLGLYDNIWAILFSGILGASNVFILRTSFRSSIPGELFDAASIDGANDFQQLWKIGIPLAKATISVVTLYAIVGCWNEYFTAMIYLPTRYDLHPLQLFLRNLLLVATAISSGNDPGAAQGGNTGTSSQQSGNEGLEQIRYSLIVVSTAPVLLAYAIVQKYFKGGVMVGSVKG